VPKVSLICKFKYNICTETPPLNPANESGKNAPPIC
jgi:hypothetical protein